MTSTALTNNNFIVSSRAPHEVIIRKTAKAAAAPEAQPTVNTPLISSFKSCDILLPVVFSSMLFCCVCLGFCVHYVQRRRVGAEIYRRKTNVRRRRKCRRVDSGDTVSSVEDIFVRGVL